MTLLDDHFLPADDVHAFARSSEPMAGEGIDVLIQLGIIIIHQGGNCSNYTRTLICEVTWLSGLVDAGVLCISVVGVIYRSVATDKRSAAIKYVISKKE